MDCSTLMLVLTLSSLVPSINAIDHHQVMCQALGSSDGESSGYNSNSLWEGKENGQTSHVCGKIGEMASKDLPCSILGCKAICRKLDLSDIPRNLPDWIKVLDLSYNSIVAVRNRSMSKYTDLRAVDLSSNSISFLFAESFVGLSNLTYLDLRNNELTYVSGRFPPNVFQPLQKLVKLFISNNNPDPTLAGLEYPADELSTLKSLQALYIDGLKYPKFLPAFQNLSALILLSLSGYTHGDCHLSGLDKDTFINVPQVKCLYLVSCFIQGKNIHREAFEPLKQLQYLDLTHNEDISLENLPSVFYGLRNTTTLRHLGLHLIVPRYSLGNCLTKQSLQFFPQSVEYLHAQDNSLEAVTKDVVEFLPQGLKLLDLSGNYFVFGPSIRSLHKLKHLQVLKLNGRSFIYELPKRYPFQPSPMTSNPVTLRHADDCLQENEDNVTLVVKLPPALRKLEMRNAGLLYRLTEIHFDQPNVLEEVLLNGNTFPSVEGPLIGLSSIRILDLSACFIRDIRSAFFTNISSLTVLRLNKNELSHFFATIDSCKIFSRLCNLETLDLSENNIETLLPDVFYGLNKLKYLYLNGNLITRFKCDISHMSNLHLLNLNYTHIPVLDLDTRRSIDALIKSKVPIKIDMAADPISCDCGNKDFLEWMTTSGAFDPSFHRYRCDYQVLILEEVKDAYAHAMQLLRRTCSVHVYLLLVVSLTATVIIVIIVASICYRFRWNLRYLYHVAYIHYKKEHKADSSDFEFDVFVCYAKEDGDFAVNVLSRELTQRGLRVYIHQRHFKAGEFIASNIVGAVCRCRRTLVLVTSQMLKSGWCNYEIQMANMEAVHTGRKVLVFLLKGTNPVARDNLNVFYNIQINTYIEYPSPDEASEAQMQAMWSKLARDLED